MDKNLMTDFLKENMGRYLIKGAFTLMPGLLGADLIYLYVLGAWYDPIKMVEYAELAAMGGLILLSVLYFKQWLREYIAELERYRGRVKCQKS